MNLPDASIPPQVRAYLDAVCDGAGKLAVACSGGSDSVGLLHVLVERFGVMAGDRLVVLHFDHRTRGAESSADAAFVRNLARRLGLPCVCGRREAKGAASEADLRKARFSFFAAAMRDTGATFLATGHVREDIAETLLMRLASGSSLTGLTAPRPVSKAEHGLILLRPLLACGKAEIRAMLKAAGHVWREDASNAGDAYLRNRVRHRVLPALAEAQPERDVATGFARSRRLLEEDDAALNAMAARWITNHRDAELERLDLSEPPPRAILRRALMLFAQADIIVALDADTLDAVLDDLEASRAFRRSAGREAFVYFDGRMLQITRRPTERTSYPPLFFRPDATVALPTGASLKASLMAIAAPEVESITDARQVDPWREAYLAVGREFAEEAVLEVRTWQPGDRMHMLGAPGSAKLQDIFTDKRYTQEMRHSLPVIIYHHCDQHEVIWVPGLPPAKHFRLHTGTPTALRLTYNV